MSAALQAIRTIATWQYTLWQVEQGNRIRAISPEPDLLLCPGQQRRISLDGEAVEKPPAPAWFTDHLHVIGSEAKQSDTANCQMID